MRDDKKKQPTQKTPKGLEIPIPTEDEFERLVKKAATKQLPPKEPSPERSPKQ